MLIQQFLGLRLLTSSFWWLKLFGKGYHWHCTNPPNNIFNNEIINLINQIETVNNHLDHLKLAVEELNYKLNSIPKIEQPTDIKK